MRIYIFPESPVDGVPRRDFQADAPCLQSLHMTQVSPLALIDSAFQNDSEK